MSKMSQQLWIAFKFYAEMYGPQRMNPTYFGEPLTYPLVPPQG